MIIKRSLFAFAIIFMLASVAHAQFSFYLIDNFEDGNFSKSSKWWRFGELRAELAANPSVEARDLIAESCGEYVLDLSGETSNWYVGGVGTNLAVDASSFSRFQLDLYGVEAWAGKLKIEFFDDDNQNYRVEQDVALNYEPVYDDKWVAEVNIQGQGFTRISIPFSAFRDVNPGIGDDTWNPDHINGSGGLLQLQLVAIANEEHGKMGFYVDNLLLTY